MVKLHRCEVYYHVPAFVGGYVGYYRRRFRGSGVVLSLGRRCKLRFGFGLGRYRLPACRTGGRLYVDALDNNEVERINRYISLTRRRLTIGSHSGAEAAALYHSPAITCHRCGVNVFDYFCDTIDRCAAWLPNTPIEKYRDLLPDRWKPQQK